MRIRALHNHSLTAKPELRLRRIGLHFLILLLFACTRLTASANQDSKSPAIAHSAAKAQFAVADFDGDVRPDLATVESGSNHAGASDYWVQLRLTTAGRQSIRLIAPSGGLWIEARDVNGDHAVDLVLTTAWLNQPVAILLNDGHGRFSRVQPSAFPAAFSEPETNLGSDSKQGFALVGVPAQSGVNFCRKRRYLDRPPQAHLRFRSSRAFLPDVSLRSLRGRAPPALA